MSSLLKFFSFKSHAKSSENISFYRFYILQWLNFTSSLARGTAIGFVLYKLGATAQELGVLTSVSMGGMLLGYFVNPYLQKKLQHASVVFNLAQYATALNSLLLMGYILFCFHYQNWGSYWVWMLINAVGAFFISIDQSSRPLFVKKIFPNIIFSKILRQDVLTMGVAKIIGFSTGAFIVSKLWVFFIFLIGFGVSVTMIYYVKKLKEKPEIKTIEIVTSSQVIIKNFSYLHTVGLHLVTCLLLFPINTQAITYAKIWNIPFYWFYICGSLGNVFFNMIINPRVGMDLKKSYFFYVFCLIFGFSLFLTSSHLVLLGSFLIGGGYSSLSVLSSSRLYETIFNGGRNIISRFYIIGSIGCIIGSYILGELLGHLHKDTVFIILIVFSSLLYGALILPYKNMKQRFVSFG